MKYLLPLLLLLASGCAPFHPGTLREPVTDEQHRLEKAYWSGFEDGADNGWKMGRESGLKAGKVTVSGCPDTVKAPSPSEQAKKPLSISDLYPYFTADERWCNDEADACWVNLEAVEYRRLHANDKIMPSSVKEESSCVREDGVLHCYMGEAGTVERIP